MLYLGIETSCDDTAVSLMLNEECLANEIVTQDSSEFGGVVPEYASREHMDVLPNLISKVLKNNGYKLTDLNFIAATQGPGLHGSLMVGVTYAKTLAWSLKIPWIGVHHLEGHLIVAKWKSELKFPFGVLLVSGGHTSIIAAHDLAKYETLGSTMDDAVGEMFDKIGRCLGFPNPAGPYMEKCAQNAQNTVKLPIPLYKDTSIDFSFSGLKSAAMRFWEKSDKSEQTKSDLCMSLQNIVYESLKSRLENAWEKSDITSWAFVGGVASNLFIRERIQKLCIENGKTLFMPDPKLCRDNGLMIAYTGYLYAKKGWYSSYEEGTLAAYKIDSLKMQT